MFQHATPTPHEIATFLTLAKNTAAVNAFLVEARATSLLGDVAIRNEEEKARIARETPSALAAKHSEAELVAALAALRAGGAVPVPDPTSNGAGSFFNLLARNMPPKGKKRAVDNADTPQKPSDPDWLPWILDIEKKQAAFEHYKTCDHGTDHMSVKSVQQFVHEVPWVSEWFLWKRLADVYSFFMAWIYWICCRVDKHEDLLSEHELAITEIKKKLATGPSQSVSRESRQAPDTTCAIPEHDKQQLYSRARSDHNLYLLREKDITVDHCEALLVMQQLLKDGYVKYDGGAIHVCIDPSSQGVTSPAAVHVARKAAKKS
ncbi:hypothetical protein CYMTET_41852 [Cymbomonas tetramitiformis]|uniref:Uncharacterized protein n=1 Tax=Cymbomonas tetramitiformis TaxID=36881 RepID=A0AAE0C6Z9_9CHLO|nr:hypothetical protein CYMTET_41852 [Cymbomonas tetramitiformis]